jgi:hypothetical protein
MTTKSKSKSKNPTVSRFVELTDYFECEAEKMMELTFDLSDEDKNEIAQELEATIQNIKFMINFFSSLKR